MHSYYSTKNVPEPERLNYWNELVCRNYVNLEIKQRSEEPFFGSIEVEPLGCTELSVVDSCQQLARRKFLNRSSAEDDLYMLILQARSCGILRQDSREVKLIPGHWTLIDSTRPYEIFGSGHFRHLVMSIPKTYLKKWHQNAKNITAMDLMQELPLGEVVAEHLNLLFRSLNKVHADERLVLGDSVLNLISGALMGALSDNKEAEFSDSNKIELMKMYIHRHLRDPELSIGSIAEALRVSRRYVHKLFESQGISVSEYIRNLRLDKCRSDLLSDTTGRRAITEIAFSWGFNSPAHFSTLFKKRYGKSPREIRT